MNDQNQPAKPSNYLVLAILSTVLCCLPTGIASIIYATKVNEAYARGEYELAEKSSKNAKMWGIIGIVAAAVGWIIYVAIFGLAILGGMASGDF